MAKRFPVGPLSEHDDDWLTVWAWLANRSKSAQAGSLVSIGINEKKTEIERILEYVAKKRGMSPDELFEKILDGTIDTDQASPEESE
ncbi:hypothetical protein [Phormidesmis priestleyi]